MSLRRGAGGGDPLLRPGVRGDLRLRDVPAPAARPHAGGRRDNPRLQLGGLLHNLRRPYARRRPDPPAGGRSRERPPGPGDGPDRPRHRLRRRRAAPGDGLSALHLARHGGRRGGRGLRDAPGRGPRTRGRSRGGRGAGGGTGRGAERRGGRARRIGGTVTGAAASQVLPVLPAGIPWVLAAVLALLDGRRRWVGLLAALGLGASLVSLVWLASVVLDRKSTRLNSSHANISYAVFCLKKKTPQLN